VRALVLAALAGFGVHVLVGRPSFPWRVAHLDGPDEHPGRRRPRRGPQPRHLRRHSRSRTGERSAAAPPDDLADCADLLHVAAAGGAGVLDALDVVLDASPAGGPTARALRTVRSDFDRGIDLVTAVDRLPDLLGGHGRALAAALAATATTGTALAPAMRALADAERGRRRRHLEARLRRLPVLLLLPLVGLVLPAFVVVALVPTAVATARSGSGLGALGAAADPPMSPPPRHPTDGRPPWTEPPTTAASAPEVVAHA
jgi:hypothetical protein